MSMLEEPIDNMAYGKVGIFGSAGSGKTFTATQLAIGLHKYAKCNKPIAMFDTEPAYHYIKKYYKEAGIEFKVYAKSRALVDLIKFMDEAEKKCSIIVIDSITHVWRDCCDSYLKKINAKRREKGFRYDLESLEFQHWKMVKDAFGKFTDKYLTAKAHVIVCGRAADIYEYQENDKGKKELITNGSRMASEKEMGYEPSLLIEMWTEFDNELGKDINKCLVKKDRSNNINGQVFISPSFKTFKKHFDEINFNSEHFESLKTKDSQEMFPEVDTGFSHEAKNREIWCEEIQGLLLKYYPSRKEEDLKAKAELIEKVFATRSWTKVESMNSDRIKQGFEQLRDILEPVLVSAEQTPEQIEQAKKYAAEFFGEQQ